MRVQRGSSATDSGATDCSDVDLAKIVIVVVSARSNLTVPAIHIRHAPILAAKSNSLPPDSCRAGPVSKRKNGPAPGVRAPAHGRTGTRRLGSGRLDEADLLSDLAVDRLQDRRAGETHLAPGRGRKGFVAPQEVIEGRSGMRAAAFPPAGDIVSLGNEFRVPQKLRSGNAARKSVMKALISSRPRRGSCNEYCRNMSGAAISSMTARLTFWPQNSVKASRRRAIKAG